MVTKEQIDSALDQAFAVVFPDGKMPENALPSRKSHKWSKTELQHFAKKGMSAGEVAKALGVSKSAVIGAAWRNGVKLREAKRGRPCKDPFP